MSLQLLAAASSPLAMSTAEAVLFWTVAPVTVVASSALLFSKRAVITACGVILAMVGMAFLYVGLGAPFLGIVQVVVYTGAIMMLFVFVLMLVGIDLSDSFIETLRGQRWIALLLAIGLLVVLGGVALRATWSGSAGVDAMNASEGGNPGALAKTLFSDHAFTMEVTGCLLIISAVGAVVLTHRQRITRVVGQAEIAERAVKRGVGITPLPSPGVYARHNAVDVPALDAEGRPIKESVAEVVRMRGQVYRLQGVSEDLVHELPPTNRAAGPPPAADQSAPSQEEEQP